MSSRQYEKGRFLQRGFATFELRATLKLKARSPNPLGTLAPSPAAITPHWAGKNLMTPSHLFFCKDSTVLKKGFSEGFPMKRHF